jgi:hypothetical protein
MIDFNLHNGSPINNSDISLILQQIDIMFDTIPGEVLGDEEFGTQYDSYLYRLKLSAEEIECKVLSDINQLELFGFEPMVKAYLLQGSERDIILIKIELHRDNEYYEKIYKIT